MLAVVAVGISLVVYSRNERLHPAIVGPTATDNWQSALAVDICGVVQPNLAANPNLTAVGIRTFGNGLVDADPGAVATGSAAYEGANATLGKFASSYPGFTLTDSRLTLPVKGAKTYSNGDRCAAAAGSKAGAGTLVAKVWASPTSAGRLITSGITKIHLANGEMITVAFVPAGASIPVPSSRSALLQALGTAPVSSTTAAPAASTTTTAPAASTTTTAPSKTGKG